MDLKALSRAEETNFENFLFYDIEVFRFDTLIVFKDINGETVKTFHNDFEGLEELVRGKVLVGYNNYHYDDIILSALLLNKPQEKVFQYNNEIISGLNPFPVDPKIVSLDCWQQINVAKSSLKKVEANIGMDIEETPVPFDIPRPLTEGEYDDVLYYCSHDVLATVNIFKLRWHSYFVGKLQITSMLPKELQRKALRWNTTTITANILVPDREKLMKWGRPYMASTDFSPEERALIKEGLYSKVPRTVSENWDKDYANVKKCTHHEFGCTFEFGAGGLHGVPEGGHVVIENNVKLLDVTSLYPNIILQLKPLGKFTETYKTIVEQRVSIKHKDPVLSNALKLIINSTYGLMKNEYSKLRNDRGALAVCIYGQILLFDLCRRLYEAGYHLINVNTDGVAFNAKGSVLQNYEEIQAEWEAEYGLQLELSEFDKWIQKDVNNYIATQGDRVKVKGGMVNHYHDPTDYRDLPLEFYAGVNWSGTNSLGIVHKVLVEVMTQHPREEWPTCGIQDKVYHYIYDDPQPILFQYILQAGNTYKGVYDTEGNEYQKVNRVFATRGKGVTLQKHKEIVNGQGETVVSKQYFPNAPKNMYVYNKDLRNFTDFEDIIDGNYYVDLVKEKLSSWT